MTHGLWENEILFKICSIAIYVSVLFSKKYSPKLQEENIQPKLLYLLACVQSVFCAAGVCEFCIRSV